MWNCIFKSWNAALRFVWYEAKKRKPIIHRKRARVTSFSQLPLLLACSPALLQTIINRKFYGWIIDILAFLWTELDCQAFLTHSFSHGSLAAKLWMRRNIFFYLNFPINKCRLKELSATLAFCFHISSCRRRRRYRHWKRWINYDTNRRKRQTVFFRSSKIWSLQWKQKQKVTWWSRASCGEWKQWLKGYSRS